MSTPLYLTHAALRRDAASAALRALLVPSSPSERAAAGHRVVWTLFGDRADRERDFLWREVEDGQYCFLSQRPPEDRHGFFDLGEPAPFEPVFAVGERVRFSLRANATVSRRSLPDQKRGKPSDVVMDALFGLPIGQRAALRHTAIADAGARWLVSQGMRCGFSCAAAPVAAGEDVDVAIVPHASSVRVSGYQTLRVDHAGPAARLGVIDFDGELQVRDPALFVEALGRGFGRAKAFGCGLMMVQREGELVS